MMVIASTTSRRALWLVFVMLISGCVSTDMSDLQMRVDEILARPGGRLEPLPEIKPYEAYAYKSAQAGARDPFQLFYQRSQEAVADAKDSGLTEAMEREIKFRNREELESYELDSLRMVGTLEDQNTQWAIVRDPQGTVHRVRVGNYLGRNIGKILNIQEDSIELREIVKNIDGRWEERQAALALAGD